MIEHHKCLSLQKYPMSFSRIVDFILRVRLFGKKSLKPVENFVQNKVRWTDKNERFLADLTQDPSFGNIRTAVEKKSP